MFYVCIYQYVEVCGSADALESLICTLSKTRKFSTQAEIVIYGSSFITGKMESTARIAFWHSTSFEFQNENFELLVEEVHRTPALRRAVSLHMMSVERSDEMFDSQNIEIHHCWKDETKDLVRMDSREFFFKQNDLKHTFATLILNLVSFGGRIMKDAVDCSLEPHGLFMIEKMNFASLSSEGLMTKIAEIGGEEILAKFFPADNPMVLTWLKKSGLFSEFVDLAWEMVWKYRQAVEVIESKFAPKILYLIRLKKAWKHHQLMKEVIEVSLRPPLEETLDIFARGGALYQEAKDEFEKRFVKEDQRDTKEDASNKSAVNFTIVENS